MLLLRTLSELLLLVVGIPTVTFSWRTYHFYKAACHSEDFFGLLIGTLGNLVLDTPYVPMYLLTVVSWRSVDMRAGILGAASDAEARAVICKQTCKLLRFIK